MKKKFFSLLLVAASLLCSGMALAADYSVSNWSELNDALSRIKEDPTTQAKITLTQTISQEASIVIEAGENIILDLGSNTLQLQNDKGKDIATDACCSNFVIKHGKLVVKGNGGKIVNNTDSKAIWNADKQKYTSTAKSKSSVTGDYLPTYKNAAGKAIYCFHLMGDYNDPQTPYGYTSLTIEEGVSVYVKTAAVDDRTKEVEDGKDFGGKCAIDIYPVYTSGDNKGKCYGVELIVNGYVYGNKYGIQASGNLNKIEGNIPMITIGENATVVGSSTDIQGCGLYVGGYVKVNVAGEVKGATGAYIKSGEVTFDGATVSSTWNGEYISPTSGKGSGVEAGGSGIVVNSVGGAYAGNMSVVIKGETTVTGSNGYAIDERVDEGKTNTEVKNLTIESGNFSSTSTEANHTIIVSEFTKENTVVNGGTWSDQAAVSQGLVDPSKGAIVIETEDENGNIVYTITDTKSGSEIVWSGADMTEGTQDVYFKYTDGVNKVIGDGTNATVAKAKYLWMEYGSRLTIKKNATLIVDQVQLDYVTMGGGADEYSQIVVEPGAKLLVTGYQGLYSKNAACLVLEANTTEKAIFVFNPAVGSNKNPYATVEYVAVNAKSTSNVENDWDIIVSPFAKITRMTNDVATKELYPGRSGSWVKYFDANTNAWVQVSSWAELYDKAKPFGALAITNATANGGAKYTFEGQLQGNISGKFNLKKGFNYMGNSFMAPMDVQTLFDALGEKVKTVAHKWNGQRYESFVSREVEDLDDFSAMDFFVLEALEDVDVDLDYTNLIWNNNK